MIEILAEGKTTDTSWQTSIIKRAKSNKTTKNSKNYKNN